MSARRRIGLAAALLLIPACGGGEPETGAAPPSGAVSSGTPEATEAGLRILGLGGNAVDAAVAISLALGATEPSESGLGGSVVMLIAPAEGEPVVLHVPPEPLATAGAGAELLRPSALPVLVHAWRRFGSGRISWEQLATPARRAAELGYPLGRFRHRMIVSEYRHLLADSASAALILNPDRSIPGEGTSFRIAPLAATLEQLAETNEDDLPAGPTLSALAAEVRERVDSTAARALASAPSVREDRPLAGSYRGWTVLAPAEPYPGRQVIRALEFLESAPVGVLRGNDEVRTTWLAEALGYATSPGAPTLGTYVTGLPPLPVAVDSLRRAPGTRRPASGSTRPPPPPAAGGTEAPSPTPVPPPPDPAPPDTAAAADETSHFSVVDSDGTAVSVTQSLGGPFGARGSALGFFLGRAPRPQAAAPPSIGTAGDSAAAAAAPVRAVDPWEEPVGWAVPTVLLREGVVGLVLGSPGGPRAGAAVVQVVTDWVDGGRPLERAIASPRLHVYRDSLPRPRVALEGVVWIQQVPGNEGPLAAFGAAARETLTQRGLRLGEWVSGLEYLGLSPFFGGVNAVAREGGEWVGAADPRRDGEGRTLTDEDVLRARQDEDDRETSEEEPPLPARRAPSPPDQ